MQLAIVSSAHGYGHATRDVALADALAARGHRCTLFTAAPAAVLGARHPRVDWRVDVGLVQPDSLSEDVPATATALATRCSDAAVDALAARLDAFDGVLVDIAPAGLEAARRAGRPAVAVGNFDWAWVYRHHPELAGWARRFAEWQAPHPAVQLRPGPDLTGFARVHEGGLLGRTLPPVRVQPPGERAVLVGFGGFGLAALAAALPALAGVRWVFAPPMQAPARPDCVQEDHAPFSALLAGADLVLTKPGYGMLAEASLAGVRLVWLDRGSFPEAPFLEAAMRRRGDVKVQPGPGEPLSAAIARAVAAGLAAPRPLAVRADNAAVAACVEQALGG